MKNSSGGYEAKETDKKGKKKQVKGPIENWSKVLCVLMVKLGDI